MPEVSRIDPTLVASENLRIAVTPRMLERFKAYAGAAAVGERQLAAVCFSLGFLALTTTVSAPDDVNVHPDEVLSNILASVKS